MVKLKKGFATMSPERQREIASMGGKAVKPAQRSFSLDRKLAASAGRKGGANVPGSKRSFFQDRELARAAGSAGGSAVPDAKRSFSRDPALAAEAGRKGRVAAHAQEKNDAEETRE